MYRQSIIMILRKDNSYLVTHRTGSPQENWTFPSGGIEEAESAQDTFFRELHEEMCISKSALHNVRVSSIVHTYEWDAALVEKTGFQGQRQAIVIADFVGNSSEIDVCKTNELDQYKFVSKDELFTAIKFEDLKETLRALFAAGDL